MSPQQIVDKTTDLTLGASLAGGSMAGFTIQALTAWGSLLVIGVNIVLGCGGIYLMYLRVRGRSSKRRNRRATDEGRS